MKKLSFLEKIMYFVNAIFATGLLLSYTLPFVSPTLVASFAVLSLLVPSFIIINVVFFIFWLVKLKKQCFTSAFILGIGYFVFSPLYKFTNVTNAFNHELKVMSYNVRLFNHYKWNNDTSIAQQTFDFIKHQNPDILAIQEFFNSPEIDFKYPYKYLKTNSSSNQFGLAIYSKFKIINQGSLEFPETSNNAIFVDIVKKKDTIRVYNLHLQSLKINPSKENFGAQDSEKLIERIGSTFKKQAFQTEMFIQHEQYWKGKKIVCGDFNNTAYSWVYNQIAANKKDAYIEAGKGFGKSFDYPFPLRIDFVLTDSIATVHRFETFSVKYSDHFPIQAAIRW